VLPLPLLLSNKIEKTKDRSKNNITKIFEEIKPALTPLTVHELGSIEICGNF
jgi:hypothetical protein